MIIDLAEFSLQLTPSSPPRTIYGRLRLTDGSHVRFKNVLCVSAYIIRSGYVERFLDLLQDGTF